MRGRQLAIDSKESLSPEGPHEGDKGDFGGIGRAMKHRFAKEKCPETHAVQAANQVIVLPALNRVRIPLTMQALVGFDHLQGDPGLLPFVLANPGTGGDDLAEGPVKSYTVSTPAHGSGETAGDMELFGKEDTTRIRRPPEKGIVVIEPGEYPHGVGQQQTCRGKVAADSQQTVRFSESGGRKNQLFDQAVNRQVFSPWAYQPKLNNNLP